MHRGQRELVQPCESSFINFTTRDKGQVWIWEQFERYADQERVKWSVSRGSNTLEMCKKQRDERDEKTWAWVVGVSPKKGRVTRDVIYEISLRGHSQLMSADISIFKNFLTPPPPQRKCPQKNVHSAINVR